MTNVSRATADSAAVAAQLARVRNDLMSGRGPGASAAEVVACTRNRVEVAGMTATRRLALTARQNAVARRDPEALLTVTQLREAEVRCGVDDSTGQLRQRGAVRRTQSTSGKPTSGGKSLVARLLAMVAVRLLRR